MLHGVLLQNILVFMVGTLKVNLGSHSNTKDEILVGVRHFLNFVISALDSSHFSRLNLKLSEARFCLSKFGDRSERQLACHILLSTMG